MILGVFPLFSPGYSEKKREKKKTHSITSQVPPAASIFDFAASENFSALNLKALVISPLPRIFKGATGVDVTNVHNIEFNLVSAVEAFFRDTPEGRCLTAFKMMPDGGSAAGFLSLMAAPCGAAPV